ncbi:glycerol-3-phosphate acyltransferase 9-like isoform X3 [Euphorbia lathyris]|uniref:glycerol-3-phosphate acyltransferase 9-like isoform X3 n=1 Tax=Euphorbia lathyris TaxID=212925 RepID=UPI0033131CD4
MLVFLSLDQGVSLFGSRSYLFFMLLSDCASPFYSFNHRCLVELICSFFVASWIGVVKYHGPRPSIRPKQVFVANHTSMVDFIILEQMTAFVVIMQKHPGWVGCWVVPLAEAFGVKEALSWIKKQWLGQDDGGDGREDCHGCICSTVG